VKGYIKDFRKELQSDIWMMPPLYHRVWQYLKYKVNHKANKIPMTDGTFLEVEPGQHLTSIRNISNDVGWYERGVFKSPNPKTISSILEWLEKQEMIKIDRGKGNRQYTLITLSNWDSYQSKEDESNSKETASKQSLDINKNDKNDKNEFSSSGSEENPLENSGFQEVYQFYYKNLQVGITESPHNTSLLSDWYDEFGKDVLIAAMKVSVEKGQKGVSYLEGILKKWRVAGVKTIEDARKYELEFRNRFNKVTPINRKKTAGEIDWEGFDIND